MPSSREMAEPILQHMQPARDNREEWNDNVLETRLQLSINIMPTLWTKKITPKYFCHTFHKTWPILTEYGVYCPNLRLH